MVCIFNSYRLKYRYLVAQCPDMIIDTFQLVEQESEGQCNSECKTIERACQEVMRIFFECFCVSRNSIRLYLYSLLLIKLKFFAFPLCIPMYYNLFSPSFQFFFF